MGRGHGDRRVGDIWKGKERKMEGGKGMENKKETKNGGGGSKG